MATEMENVLENMVHQMMVKRDVKNYKILIEAGNGNSDGFIGDMTFFTVVEMNGNHLNFVLKSAKRNDTFRSTIPATDMYNREIFMYSEYFPALQSFSDKKGLNEFLNFVPKACFISRTLNYEHIIFENLKTQNFVLWDRKKPMDMTHVKSIFENYGKLHGLCMAYKDQNPEAYSDMMRNVFDIKCTVWKNLGIIEDYKKEFRVIIKMLEECGRKDLVNIFREEEEELEYTMLRKGETEDFICMIHNDCWINNYMVKYEESNSLKLEATCILDFQLSTVDSPVIDLSAFFYSAAETTSFFNFENILSVYYNSLSKTINLLGSEPENLFSMEDLRRHWKIYAFYGVISSLILVKVQLGDADEMPDMVKMIENDEKLFGAFGFEIRNMETFRRRVLDGFIHYGEYLKFNNSDTFRQNQNEDCVYNHIKEIQ